MGCVMRSDHSIKIVPLRLILPLLLLLYSGQPWGSDTNGNDWLEPAKSALAETDQKLDSASGQKLGADRLDEIKKNLLSIRTRAQDCVTVSTAAVQQRQQDIDLLGPKLSKEAKDVTLERDNLTKERDALQKRLADCQFLLIQAKSIGDKISAIEQATLTRKLLNKGPNVWQLIQESLEQTEVWWQLASDFLMTRSGIELLTGTDLLTLIGVGILGFIGGWGLYRIWMTAIKKPAVDKFTHFLLALKSSSARLLPVIGAIGVPLIYLSAVLPIPPLPFITKVAYGLLSYTLSVGLVDAVLFPAPPADYYLDMDETTAHVLAKHLKTLLALGLVGLILFGSGFSDALLETQYLLARAVYGAFLFINLAWFLWSIGRIPSLVGTYGIRFLLLALLIFVLGAEWLGYRNLSVFTLAGLLGSLAGFYVISFINSLLSDLFDGMDFGYQPWQKRLRQHLGLKEQDRVPGLIWIRIIISIAIWSSLGLWVLWVWGLSQEGIDLITTILQEGFNIGSFHVIPVQIVTALLAFSLLFAVSDWLKQKVVPVWLNNARVERGAREALITVTGYLGLTISLLVALSIAGVEFANIAIIAGALSVGIGFGLQNIVNNFVSGLILLIERPIRTGDWILVGSTEGFVRKISIRSTQLRTFDGSDIIVPNSELISNQVTNWMLHDSMGRIKIPVGVAYGSDLEKVRDILLAIARQHEMVVSDNSRVAEPVVLMMGFGDSSLDLELRCFIRSIDKKAQVFSDLCFTIDATFKEKGIEIPFPQRDVHIKAS